ncbi:hypothetical protein MS3_00001062 [Schistosoma haematobium]|uniref:Uncharacterized protein n=1 Tax=Schistosoma haematobium TaxID=6185 RepID=A0A922LM71_SCHHA|nr:hypothetical protein MS3_00001062 [Schistosoma haematobium]KAH9589704.1 hypothetical protein MS3_00001062 [Schistosoma haematobium]
MNMSFKYLQLLLVLTLSITSAIKANQHDNSENIEDDVIDSQIADPPIVATNLSAHELFDAFKSLHTSLFSSNEADSDNSENIEDDVIDSQIADPPIVATDEPSQGLVSDFFQWLFSLFSSNEADSGNSGSHP